jgi:hypothetical protein
MTEIGKAIDAYMAWAKEELPENINQITFWVCFLLKVKRSEK